MSNTDHVERPLRPAILRGLKERCPACGRGRLLHSYLKINPHCPECGEDLTPARADDGPAYLTILVVGHLIGFGIHILYGTWRMAPLFMALILTVFAVGLSIFLLPRFKGMMVGWQWAKRMHGF